MIVDKLFDGLDWIADNIRIVLGVIAIGALIFAVWSWVDSTNPPAPKVYEGRIVTKDYEAAHPYTFMTQQGCIMSGNVCIPIMVSQTGYVPDRWYLTIVGCPRRAKESVSYCAKPKKRKVQVSEEVFNHTKVGLNWKERIR